MLITNHVISGALIGMSAKSDRQAAIAGLVSHLVLDSIPHYGTARLNAEEYGLLTKTDGIVGVAAIVALLHHTPAPLRKRTGIAIFCACLPDTDKPLTYFFGARRKWHPGIFRKIHYSVQHEHPYLWVELLVTAGFLSAFIVANRRARENFSNQVSAPPGHAAARMGQLPL